MQIIIIHREPIVARVPNLMTLIQFLSAQGHAVSVVTSASEKFPLPKFESSKVVVHAVGERTRRLAMPTLVNVLFRFIRVMIAERVRGGTTPALIFAGRGALVLCGVLSRLGLHRYLSFVVEYPDACDPRLMPLTWAGRMEADGIRRSVAFITHDDMHADLIRTSLKTQTPHLTLPNGTFGQARHRRSNFLHDRLRVPSETRLLLHSGGFGGWFASSALASTSASLPAGYRLVFHLSHDISADPYYRKYIEGREKDDTSLFSMDPVPASELDNLVGSASIGIAWYDVNELGFRARMMGLAAGKIGNYLKCGVPLIAPNLDSFAYLRESGAGVLIDDLSQVREAVREIDSDLASYSARALACYEQFWSPERHLERIHTTLRSMS